jgi:hypothetical protein
LLESGGALGDGVMGTLQVSFTAWFGTGSRFSEIPASDHHCYVTGI